MKTIVLHPLLLQSPFAVDKCRIVPIAVERAEDKVVWGLIGELVGCHLRDIYHLVVGESIAKLHLETFSVALGIVCGNVDTTRLVAIDCRELHCLVFVISFE